MQDDGDSRQRSSIGFPYNNLGEAIEVAQSIYSHARTGNCEDAQLSAWMHCAQEKRFRAELSASLLFGLVETTSGRHKLTDTSLMVVNPQQVRSDRGNAFLSVALYEAIYEKFKNWLLPPLAALEREFVGLGVAEKQTTRRCSSDLLNRRAQAA